MWLKVLIPLTVIGSSFASWAYVGFPSTSVFGMFVAASGTMLALTAAIQAYQSSVLDSWLALYAGIVTEALLGSKKYAEKTYDGGIAILEQRAKITGYVRSACYVIFASLVLSLLAVSMLLIPQRMQVCGVVSALFGACVTTLFWGGFLLAILVRKAVSEDSRECSRTIADLRGLRPSKSEEKKNKNGNAGVH